MTKLPKKIWFRILALILVVIVPSTDILASNRGVVYSHFEKEEIPIQEAFDLRLHAQDNFNSRAIELFNELRLGKREKLTFPQREQKIQPKKASPAFATFVSQFDARIKQFSTRMENLAKSNLAVRFAQSGTVGLTSGFGIREGSLAAKPRTLFTPPLARGKRNRAAIRKWLKEGLSYYEAAVWRKARVKDHVRSPHGFWLSEKTARYSILAALDTILGFWAAREAGDLGVMRDLYRKHVIAYQAEDKDRFKKNGQLAFFAEVGGLSGLFSNRLSYLSKSNSPGALLRLALPKLIDLRNPDALDPLEVERGYWDDPENAKYHTLLALDAIDGFKRARENGDLAEMARLYREKVIGYKAKVNAKYKRDGQQGFFYNEAGLAGLLSNERSYLPKMGSPAALLRLVLPELIDVRNPAALDPLEVERGYWDDPENAKYHILLALDTIEGFKEARDKGNIKLMADLYRANVIMYEPRDRQKYKKSGQVTFFSEVGGLKTLMDHPRSFLRKMSSPAELVRLVLPGLIDLRNPDALDPLEVEIGYWEDSENAKYHILLALDTIEGFKQARETDNLKVMADLYRRHVMGYKSDDQKGRRKSGQIAFFYDVGGLESLMTYPRPFLQKAGSPAALLRFALPGLINSRNPDALKPEEIELGRAERDSRPFEQMVRDRRRLAELLDEKRRSMSELAKLTGLPVGKVRKDLVRVPALMNHPNRRTNKKVAEDRAELKRLLDDELQTPQQLTDLTGIPTRIVEYDLENAPELKDHPNLIKPFARRTEAGIGTRSVTDRFNSTDLFGIPPDEAAEYYEFLAKVLPPKEFELIRMDMTVDEIEDSEIADILDVPVETIQSMRQEAWRKLEKATQDAGFGAVASMDFSGRHRGFRPHEDKWSRLGSQKRGDTEDQRGPPIYSLYRGSSLFEEKDDEDLEQVSRVGGLVSSEQLEGAFDKIGEKSRMRKSSRMEGSKQSFDRAVSEDSTSSLIPAHRTFTRLPSPSPEISLAGVDRAPGFQKEHKSEYFFGLGRRKSLEHSRQGMGNFSGSFHEKNDITLNTSNQRGSTALRKFGFGAEKNEAIERTRQFVSEWRKLANEFKKRNAPANDAAERLVRAIFMSEHLPKEVSLPTKIALPESYDLKEILPHVVTSLIVDYPAIQFEMVEEDKKEEHKELKKLFHRYTLFVVASSLSKDGKQARPLRLIRNLDSIMSSTPGAPAHPGELISTEDAFLKSINEADLIGKARAAKKAKSKARTEKTGESTYEAIRTYDQYLKLNGHRWFMDVFLDRDEYHHYADFMAALDDLSEQKLGKTIEHFVGDLIFELHHRAEQDKYIRQELNKISRKLPKFSRVIRQLVRDMLAFAESAYTQDSEEARIFLWKMGEIAAEVEVETQKQHAKFHGYHEDRFFQDEFPLFIQDDKPELYSYSFLVLGPGPIALHFLKNLKHGRYVLADRSYFVEAYLSKAKELLGVGDEVVIRRVDIRDTGKLFLEGPYRNVYMRNVLHYAGALPRDWVATLLDQVAPGGEISYGHQWEDKKSSQKPQVESKAAAPEPPTPSKHSDEVRWTAVAMGLIHLKIMENLVGKGKGNAKWQVRNGVLPTNDLGWKQEYIVYTKFPGEEQSKTVDLTHAQQETRVSWQILLPEISDEALSDWLDSIKLTEADANRASSALDENEPYDMIPADDGTYVVLSRASAQSFSEKFNPEFEIGGWRYRLGGKSQPIHVFRPNGSSFETEDQEIRSYLELKLFEQIHSVALRILQPVSRAVSVFDRDISRVMLRPENENPKTEYFERLFNLTGTMSPHRMFAINDDHMARGEHGTGYQMGVFNRRSGGFKALIKPSFHLDVPSDSLFEALMRPEAKWALALADIESNSARKGMPVLALPVNLDSSGFGAAKGDEELRGYEAYEAHFVAEMDQAIKNRDYVNALGIYFHVLFPVDSRRELEKRYPNLVKFAKDSARESQFRDFISAIHLNFQSSSYASRAEQLQNWLETISGLEFWNSDGTSRQSTGIGAAIHQIAGDIQTLTEKASQIAELTGVDVSKTPIRSFAAVENEELLELRWYRDRFRRLWNTSGSEAAISFLKNPDPYERAEIAVKNVRGHALVSDLDGATTSLLTGLYFSLNELDRNPASDDNFKTAAAELRDALERWVRYINNIKRRMISGPRAKKIPVVTTDEVEKLLNPIAALVENFKAEILPNLPEQLNKYRDSFHRRINRALNLLRAEQAALKGTLDHANTQVFDSEQLRKELFEEIVGYDWFNNESEDRWIAPAEPFGLEGNPPLFKRMLGEIINNATKAMGQIYGGKEVSFEVKEGQAIVRIRDHGPGVREDLLQEILGRQRLFYLGETTKALDKGGTGLADAWHIVKIHGGTIRAQNHPGGGAEFIITIPTHSSGFGALEGRASMKEDISLVLTFEHDISMAKSRSTTEEWERFGSSARLDERGQMLKLLKERIEEWTKWQRKPQAINLGAGDGVWSRAISQEFPKLQILDVDSAPLKRSHETGPVRFLHADAENLVGKVADHQFDIALMMFALDYMDHDRVMKEIKRVVKPEGHVLLILHHPDSYPIGLMLRFTKLVRAIIGITDKIPGVLNHGVPIHELSKLVLDLEVLGSDSYRFRPTKNKIGFRALSSAAELIRRYFDGTLVYDPSTGYTKERMKEIVIEWAQVMKGTFQNVLAAIEPITRENATFSSKEEIHKFLAVHNVDAGSYVSDPVEIASGVLIYVVDFRVPSIEESFGAGILPAGFGVSSRWGEIIWAGGVSLGASASSRAIRQERQDRQIKLMHIPRLFPFPFYSSPFGGLGGISNQPNPKSPSIKNTSISRIPSKDFSKKLEAKPAPTAMTDIARNVDPTLSLLYGSSMSGLPSMVDNQLRKWLRVSRGNAGSLATHSKIVNINMINSNSSNIASAKGFGAAGDLDKRLERKSQLKKVKDAFERLRAATQEGGAEIKEDVGDISMIVLFSNGTTAQAFPTPDGGTVGKYFFTGAGGDLLSMSLVIFKESDKRYRLEFSYTYTERDEKGKKVERRKEDKKILKDTAVVLWEADRKDREGELYKGYIRRKDKQIKQLRLAYAELLKAETAIGTEIEIDDVSELFHMLSGQIQIAFPTPDGKNIGGDEEEGRRGVGASQDLEYISAKIVKTADGQLRVDFYYKTKNDKIIREKPAGISWDGISFSFPTDELRLSDREFRVHMLKAQIFEELLYRFLLENQDDIEFEQKFFLNELSQEYRYPLFMVKGKYIGAAKWGRDGRTMIQSVLKLTRLRKMKGLAEPVQLVVFDAGKVSEATVALRATGMEGLQFEIIPASELVKRLDPEGTRGKAMLEKMKEARRLEIRRDEDGLAKMYATLREEQDALVKRHKKGLRLHEEAEWQGHLMANFIRAGPEVTLKALDELQKYHSPYWEWSYHLRLIAFLSYIYQKTDHAQIRSKITELYPQVKDDPEIWQTIVRYYKLLEYGPDDEARVSALIKTTDADEVEEEEDVAEEGDELRTEDLPSRSERTVRATSFEYDKFLKRVTQTIKRQADRHGIDDVETIVTATDTAVTPDVHAVTLEDTLAEFGKLFKKAEEPYPPFKRMSVYLAQRKGEIKNIAPAKRNQLMHEVVQSFVRYFTHVKRMDDPSFKFFLGYKGQFGNVGLGDFLRALDASGDTILIEDKSGTEISASRLLEELILFAQTLGIPLPTVQYLAHEPGKEKEAQIPRWVSLADEIIRKADQGKLVATIDDLRLVRDFMKAQLDFLDWVKASLRVGDDQPVAMPGGKVSIRIHKERLNRFRDEMKNSKAHNFSKEHERRVISDAQNIIRFHVNWFQKHSLGPSMYDLSNRMNFRAHNVARAKELIQSLGEEDFEEGEAEFLLLAYTISQTTAIGATRGVEWDREDYRAFKALLEKQGIIEKGALDHRVEHGATRPLPGEAPVLLLNEDVYGVILWYFFPEIPPERVQKLGRLGYWLFDRINRENVINERPHDMWRLLDAVSNRFFDSTKVKGSKRIVQNRFYSAELVKVYRDTFQWLKKQGLDTSHVTYPFSGADLSSVLLLTDADVIRMYDQLPFGLDARARDYERYKLTYISQKANIGITMDAVTGAIGHAKTPLLWELEALGAKDIRIEADDEDVNTYRIYFKWAYDEGEPPRERVIEYRERRLLRQKDFDEAVDLEHDTVYLNKGSEFKTRAQILPNVLISFGDESIPGYKRFPLRKIVNLPEQKKLVLGRPPRYAQIDQAVILVKSDSEIPDATLSEDEKEIEPLSDEEISTIKSSISMKDGAAEIRRADGGHITLSGESDLAHMLGKRLPYRDIPADAEFPQIPPELYVGKDVLVVSAYGNLPFDLKESGARSVIAIDKDPATVAWQRAKTLYASDPSVALVSRLFQLITARAPVEEPLRGIRFQTGDVTKSLPLEDGSVDLIIVPYLFGMTNGLTNVDDFERAMGELLRVGRPDTPIIIAPSRISRREQYVKGHPLAEFDKWLTSQQTLRIEESVPFPLYNLVDDPSGKIAPPLGHFAYIRDKGPSVFYGESFGEISADLPKVYVSLNAEQHGYRRDYGEHYRVHIEKSHEQILKGAKGLSGTALLLGLGNGVDYPLKKLAEQFDRIVVVDLDVGTVRRVISKLDPSLQRKFEIRAEDLTSMLPELTREVDRIVAEESDKNGARRRIAELAQSISLGEPVLKDLKASYVVSSGTMTQLTYYAHHYARWAMGKKFRTDSAFLTGDPAYRDAFQTSLNSRISVRHVESLRNWVLPEGRVYFSETLSATDFRREAGGGRQPIAEPRNEVSLVALEKLEELFVKDVESQKQWLWDSPPPEIHPEKIGKATQEVSGFFSPRLEPRKDLETISQPTSESGISSNAALKSKVDQYIHLWDELLVAKFRRLKPAKLAEEGARHIAHVYTPEVAAPSRSKDLESALQYVDKGTTFYDAVQGTALMLRTPGEHEILSVALAEPSVNGAEIAFFGFQNGEPLIGATHYFDPVWNRYDDFLNYLSSATREKGIQIKGLVIGYQDAPHQREAVHHFVKQLSAWKIPVVVLPPRSGSGTIIAAKDGFARLQFKERGEGKRLKRETGTPADIRENLEVDLTTVDARSWEEVFPSSTVPAPRETVSTVSVAEPQTNEHAPENIQQEIAGRPKAARILGREEILRVFRFATPAGLKIQKQFEQKLDLVIMDIARSAGPFTAGAISGSFQKFGGMNLPSAPAGQIANALNKLASTPPAGFGAEEDKALHQRMPISDEDLENLELLKVATVRVNRKKKDAGTKRVKRWDGLYDLYHGFDYDASYESKKILIDRIQRPRRHRKEIEDARSPVIDFLGALHSGQTGGAENHLEEILETTGSFSKLVHKIDRRLHQLTLGHYPEFRRGIIVYARSRLTEHGPKGMTLVYPKPFSDVALPLIQIAKAVVTLQKLNALLPDGPPAHPESKPMRYQQWKSKIQEVLSRPELKPFLERKELLEFVSGEHSHPMIFVSDETLTGILEAGGDIDRSDEELMDILTRSKTHSSGMFEGSFLEGSWFKRNRAEEKTGFFVHHNEAKWLKFAQAIRRQLRASGRLETLQQQYDSLIAEFTKENSELWRRTKPVDRKGKTDRERQHEEKLKTRVYTHDYIRQFAHGLMRSLVAEIDFYTRLVLMVERDKYIFAGLNSSQGVVHLHSYVNPILSGRNTEEIKPITIDLGDGKSALLLSGPNMGGKTTTARGIGLAVLLTQAGLPIPAEWAELSIFRNIYTVFPSSEQAQPGYGYFEMLLKKLTELSSKAGPGDLILLDEVPTGTEYSELVAIATVLIEDLIQTGATVVVTGHLKKVFELLSHHSEVKTRMHTVEEKDGRVVPNFGLKEGIAKHSYGIELSRGIFSSKVTELARRYYAFIMSGAEVVESPDLLLPDPEPEDKKSEKKEDEAAFDPWLVRELIRKIYPKKLFAFNESFRIYGDTQDKIVQILSGSKEIAQRTAEMQKQVLSLGLAEKLPTVDPAMRLELALLFMGKDLSYLEKLTQKLNTFKRILKSEEDLYGEFKPDERVKKIDALKKLLTEFIAYVEPLDSPFVKQWIEVLYGVIAESDRLRESYGKTGKDVNADLRSAWQAEWMMLAGSVVSVLSLFDEFTGIARANIHRNLKAPLIVEDANTFELKNSKPFVNPKENEEESSSWDEYDDEGDFDFSFGEKRESILSDPFVENATAQSFWVDPERPVLVVTGSNSSGKTVAMFDNALVNALLAKEGFYVSGDMKTSRFDKIFAVRGGENVTSGGESYFLSILRQYGHILKRATSKSLVIMDELHGTDNFEMAAIQLAVLHYLRKLGATVLYNTHIRDGLKEAGEKLDLDFWKTDISYNEGTGEIIYHFTLSPDPELKAESLGRRIAAKWLTPDQNRRVDETYGALVEASGFGAIGIGDGSPISETALLFARQFDLKPHSRVLSIGTGDYNDSELAFALLGHLVKVMDPYNGYDEVEDLPARLNPLGGKHKDEKLGRRIAQARGKYEVIPKLFTRKTAAKHFKANEFDLIIVANVSGLDVGPLARIVDSNGYLVMVSNRPDKVAKRKRALRYHGLRWRTWKGLPYYTDNPPDFNRASNEPTWWIERAKTYYLAIRGKVSSSGFGATEEGAHQILGNYRGFLNQHEFDYTDGPPYMYFPTDDVDLHEVLPAVKKGGRQTALAVSIDQVFGFLAHYDRVYAVDYNPEVLRIAIPFLMQQILLAPTREGFVARMMGFEIKEGELHALEGLPLFLLMERIGKQGKLVDATASVLEPSFKTLREIFPELEKQRFNKVAFQILEAFGLGREQPRLATYMKKPRISLSNFAEQTWLKDHATFASVRNKIQKGALRPIGGSIAGEGMEAFFRELAAEGRRADMIYISDAYGWLTDGQRSRFLSKLRNGLEQGLLSPEALGIWSIGKPVNPADRIVRLKEFLSVANPSGFDFSVRRRIEPIRTSKIPVWLKVIFGMVLLAVPTAAAYQIGMPSAKDDFFVSAIVNVTLFGFFAVLRDLAAQWISRSRVDWFQVVMFFPIGVVMGAILWAGFEVLNWILPPVSLRVDWVRHVLIAPFRIAGQFWLTNRSRRVQSKFVNLIRKRKPEEKADGELSKAKLDEIYLTTRIPGIVKVYLVQMVADPINQILAESALGSVFRFFDAWGVNKPGFIAIKSPEELKSRRMYLIFYPFIWLGQTIAHLVRPWRNRSAVEIRHAQRRTELGRKTNDRELTNADDASGFGSNQSGAYRQLQGRYRNLWQKQGEVQEKYSSLMLQPINKSYYYNFDQPTDRQNRSIFRFGLQDRWQKTTGQDDRVGGQTDSRKILSAFGSDSHRNENSLIVRGDSRGDDITLSHLQKSIYEKDETVNRTFISVIEPAEMQTGLTFLIAGSPDKLKEVYNGFTAARKSKKGLEAFPELLEAPWRIVVISEEDAVFAESFARKLAQELKTPIENVRGGNWALLDEDILAGLLKREGFIYLGDEREAAHLPPSLAESMHQGSINFGERLVMLGKFAKWYKQLAAAA